MSTENLYRRDGRRFVAVKPGTSIAMGTDPLTFGDKCGITVLMVLCLLGMWQVGSWTYDRLHPPAPPEPAPLLPHSSIEIPAPLPLPSWEIPPQVFYYTYELPPAKRGITFNGNQR